MFPLDFTHIKNLLSPKEWDYVSFAGFEERWLGFPLQCKIAKTQPQNILLFEPDLNSFYDNFSDICERTKHQIKRLKGEIDWNIIPLKIDLNDSSEIEIQFEQFSSSCSSGIVFVDITSMPRSLYFPLIKQIINSKSYKTVVVVYTKPIAYDLEDLHRDPLQNVNYIYGFDFVPETSEIETAWIPLHGFGSQFILNLNQNIKESSNLGQRVYPILGFPAFDPLFFNRSLRGANKLLLDANKDQIKYAQADDPFDTFKVISELIESHKPMQWIGSPFGTKPMGVGLLLAAIDFNITIATIQSRWYNPNFSTGIGASKYYLLKDEGLLVWRQ